MSDTEVVKVAVMMQLRLAKRTGQDSVLTHSGSSVDQQVGTGLVPVADSLTRSICLMYPPSPQADPRSSILIVTASATITEVYNFVSIRRRR